MAKTKLVVPLTKDQAALAAQWLRLARKITAKHGLDEDVAYEAVCRAARGFDPAKGWTMQAWATAIINNACIDEHRKKKAVLVPLEDYHVGGHAPAPAWTPPADVPERPVRAAGMSARSLRRRAKEQGWSRPRGRPQVLDRHALAQALASHKGRPLSEVARDLGVGLRTLYDCAGNGQKLSRLRGGHIARTFGGASTNRPAPASADPGPRDAPRWG